MAIPILDANGQTQQLLTDEEVQTITDALADRLDVVEDQLEGLEEALHLINTGSSGETPTEHPETRFTLQDGTVETYDITGTLYRQWMVDNGYFDETTTGTWQKTITQADIGNTITSIDYGVFANCTSIMSVTIPNSVESIGPGAFDGCSGLTSITIGNSVSDINTGAFSGCSSLTSVTIPDSVTNIENYAFYGCTGLTSVTIISNGGNANTVKNMMINAGVDENITWNMPS